MNKDKKFRENLEGKDKYYKQQGIWKENYVDTHQMYDDRKVTKKKSNETHMMMKYKQK